MRRVLHVPASDLRQGDKVSMGDSSELGSVNNKIAQPIVTESRPEDDIHYGGWYLKFDIEGWNQICARHKQFTLLMDDI